MEHSQALRGWWNTSRIDWQASGRALRPRRRERSEEGHRQMAVSFYVAGQGWVSTTGGEGGPISLSTIDNQELPYGEVMSHFSNASELVELNVRVTDGLVRSRFVYQYSGSTTASVLTRMSSASAYISRRLAGSCSAAACAVSSSNRSFFHIRPPAGLPLASTGLFAPLAAHTSRRKLLASG